MRYMLIVSESPERLNELVSERLTAGFILYGPPLWNHGTEWSHSSFAQAVRWPSGVHGVSAEEARDDA